MPSPKRNKLVKDLTADFLAGQMDEDRAEGMERFSRRSKFHQQNKTARTAGERQSAASAEFDALPVGRVIQVFSRLCEVVAADGSKRLCALRKTLSKQGDVVVGDRVRFRDEPQLDANGQRQGVIERVEPRSSILTRADSFKAIVNHPIVANAQQMLIVAALVQPLVKWGLIDRMLIAAQSGNLRPILCLNKIDLAAPEELADGRAKLAHYATLGIETIETSVSQAIGLTELRERLLGQTTVLAGHSGVGKSSLVRAIEPALAEIKIGEISSVHLKGKHTTTSARIYPLSSGEVIDTPGVKLFGLWNVTDETIDDFFPDVAADDAPAWRAESYERIRESLGTRRQ